MRIACCQFNVVFGDPVANAARAVSALRDLKTQGVDLVVFPEAFLTGYCVRTSEDAERISIKVSCQSGLEVSSADESLLQVQSACVELGMHAVIGFAGDNQMDLYNGAVLIKDDGTMLRYIKTHLPELGFDKFVFAGDDLPVFETKFGKIGILICFDLRHPEAARVLALKGADLIVLPTNWPNGAQMAAELFSIVRAVENRVFVATCNRVGTENGFSFIGLSKIIEPTGKVLAAAGDEEEILIADIDLLEARNKRITIIPGEYEITTEESRRAKLYGRICD